MDVNSRYQLQRKIITSQVGKASGDINLEVKYFYTFLKPKYAMRMAQTVKKNVVGVLLSKLIRSQ